MSLKNFVNEQLFFRIGEVFVGTKTLHYRSRIRKMRGWPSSEIIKWQDNRLRILIDHAYTNTPYYKELFNNLGIKPADIRSVADLQQIPKLTKSIIRANKEKLIPQYTIGNFRRASSGGSSGDPLQFFVSHESWSFINAYKLLQWEKIGFKLGDNHIALGSSSLFPLKKRSLKHDIYYLLKGKIPVNGISFTDEEYIRLVALIKRKKVKYIYGYASSIFLFANFLKSSKTTLPQIKGIISTSEILLDNYYSVIKEVFDAPILDAYGAADGGVSAYRLDDSRFEVAYNSIVEIEKHADMNSGPILATDLLNFAFPFIRYELGDEVELDTNTETAYNGQTLGKVFGRIPDVIKLANGRVLTGPGFTILFKDLNVTAYRISSPASNILKCEIQKGPGFTTDEHELIQNTLRHQTGEGIQIVLDYKDSFASLPSGKRNYFFVTG